MELGAPTVNQWRKHVAQQEPAPPDLPCWPAACYTNEILPAATAAATPWAGKPTKLCLQLQSFPERPHFTPHCSAMYPPPHHHKPSLPPPSSSLCLAVQAYCPRVLLLYESFQGLSTSPPCSHSNGALWDLARDHRLTSGTGP